MAARMSIVESRTFHFTYASPAGWCSGVVAIPLVLGVILAFFSIALLVASVFSVAVLAIVAHWFRARRAPPRETAAKPGDRPWKIVARLDGPKGSTNVSRS